MEIVVGSNFENALQKFKKMVQRDGVFAAISRRLEPKPSVRKRDKRRKALRRLKKIEGRRDGRVSINEGAPSWRFVHTDGEYVKVPVKRGGLHQREGQPDV